MSLDVIECENQGIKEGFHLEMLQIALTIMFRLDKDYLKAIVMLREGNEIYCMNVRSTSSPPRIQLRIILASSSKLMHTWIFKINGKLSN